MLRFKARSGSLFILMFIAPYLGSSREIQQFSSKARQRQEMWASWRHKNLQKINNTTNKQKTPKEIMQSVKQKPKLIVKHFNVCSSKILNRADQENDCRWSRWKFANKFCISKFLKTSASHHFKVDKLQISDGDLIPWE